MKNLIAAVVASFFYAAVAHGEVRPNAPEMKRAHKVEPVEVKTIRDDLVTVKAILTYGDGTKAECKYLAKVDKIGSSTGLDNVGIQLIPAYGQEVCKPFSGKPQSK